MEIIAIFGNKKDAIPASSTGFFSPTVSLAMHASNLGAKRLHLLVQKEKNIKDVGKVVSTIETIAPALDVNLVELEPHDPFDPKETWKAILPFVNELPSDREYLFSLATGTHIHIYVFAKLVESSFLNARAVQAKTGGKSALALETINGVTFYPGSINVIDLDLDSHDIIAERLRRYEKEDDLYLRSGIPTQNAGYNALIKDIEKVGIRSDDPVLLMGPSGAGKTALATRIYDLRKQRGLVKGEFVYLNCATLKAEQVMDVLFGHEKGAFTGASSSRGGLLEKANGGGLFLDEMATLPTDVQSMLLHVLETGVYYPLGSDTAKKSRFALICGTNESLENAVYNGTFRGDLLARIDVWTFTLPGLKERREDISPNIDFELAVLREKTGKRIRFEGKARKTFEQFALSPSATWDRNFRDLKNALKRMVTLSEGGVIGLIQVESEIARLKAKWRGLRGGDLQKEDVDLLLYVEESVLSSMSMVDRFMLSHVIRTCQKSVKQRDAAYALYANDEGVPTSTNIASRLTNYLSKYQLKFSDLKKEQAV